MLLCYFSYMKYLRYAVIIPAPHGSTPTCSAVVMWINSIQSGSSLRTKLLCESGLCSMFGSSHLITPQQKQHDQHSRGVVVIAFPLPNGEWKPKRTGGYWLEALFEKFYMNSHNKCYHSFRRRQHCGKRSSTDSFNTPQWLAPKALTYFLKFSLQNASQNLSMRAQQLWTTLEWYAQGTLWNTIDPCHQACGRFYYFTSAKLGTKLVL